MATVANEGLANLMHMLRNAEFCKAFVLDPMGALDSRKIDGVPYAFVNVLAELSYDELRLVGRLGVELKAVVGDDGGLLF